MKTLDLSTTTTTLRDAARSAKSDTVILTRRGKAVAAIVPLDDQDWESISLANNPRFIEIIQESRRSFREDGGRTSDEVREMLGISRPKKRKSHNRRGRV